MGNRDFLKIDKYALDEEAEKLPMLVMEHGEARNEAEGRKDRAYARYKVVKAEKSLYYRKNPPAGTKVTDSTISDLIDADGEVREAHDAFLTAQEEFAILDVVYQAVRDKSSKIRDLIQLHLAGYFGDSRASEIKKKRERDALNEVAED